MDCALSIAASRVAYVLCVLARRILMKFCRLPRCSSTYHRFELPVAASSALTITLKGEYAKKEDLKAAFDTEDTEAIIKLVRTLVTHIRFVL